MESLPDKIARLEGALADQAALTARHEAALIRLAKVVDDAAQAVEDRMAAHAQRVADGLEANLAALTRATQDIHAAVRQRVAPPRSIPAKVGP